jgi:hypothetical protein
MNTTEPSPAHIRCEYWREELRQAIATLDKIEAIMEPLPADMIDHCDPSGGYLQLSNLDREQVKVALSRIHPGRWEKEQNGTTINYRGIVNGIRVLIFAAQPPEACRIEERIVDVPAHTKIERVLVCA